MHLTLVKVKCTQTFCGLQKDNMKKHELFIRLAQPDKNGISRWVGLRLTIKMGEKIIKTS